MEVWRAIAEGLNAVIVNPSIIIGASAGRKGSGQLFERGRKGLRFYTSGSNGFVDVEDVAKVMELLMNSNISSERFILNSENLSLKEFFTEMAHGYNMAAPNIEVKPWLMEIGWRSAGLLSSLNGKKYGLTKDTAQNAFKRVSYSNQKFLEYFPDFKFKPIRASIKEICDASKK
jgi:nucleoside-diphosphate-sugar epimerase